jgi:tetratricopeptide (TPR) repeat protein
MKRTSLCVTFLLACAAFAYPQHAAHMSAPSAESAARPATLMRGFGGHHHPVKAGSAEAQRFFDQGLTLVYAFNHEEALRSFRRAAELDPRMAMAYWGVALASGPSITAPIGRAQQKVPYEAIQKALSLAADAPENERAYIEAMAKRYSVEPKADLKRLALDYREAMKEVAKLYPDDLDAATLYAESVIELRPFQPFWTADGKPAENTDEVIGLLESVLRRDPDHVGAIHYYIHAVEASPDPERALPYALRLRSLLPAAGHIVHMPAHLYMRLGDYAAASASNREAAAADREYMKTHGDSAGTYGLMFYTHTFQYLAISSAMEGRFGEAMEAARQVEKNVAPHMQEMPYLEALTPISTLVLVRFRRWDDILALPRPDESKKVSAVYSHFARGLALSARGEVAEAEKEQQAFTAAVAAVPPKMAFGTNRLVTLFQIADKMLAARISVARRDYANAVELLRAAAAVEDALVYDEPPPWLLPVRESLGAALYLSGDFAAAEQTFRDDLKKHPRNGRALFGLLESLRRQKKDYAAGLVEKEFAAAWKNADTRLTVEEL